MIVTDQQRGYAQAPRGLIIRSDESNTSKLGITGPIQKPEIAQPKYAPELRIQQEAYQNRKSGPEFLPFSARSNMSRC